MQQPPRLPKHARLPINRCNLPADILGGLSFQDHPIPLLIDGIEQLHGDFFYKLDAVATATQRAGMFQDYMAVVFRLHKYEDIGFEPDARIDRRKADYRNVIKGWFFNPDSIEAAVLKSWVESRFGLVTRFHKSAIQSVDDHAYLSYMEDRCTGLYNTNALESQLDLVFSYCQYELHRQHEDIKHFTLYRGINRICELDVINTISNNEHVVLLNNINSFSENFRRASEFGDYILNVDVPFSKIFYFNGLLPIHTQGEDEFVVIGGLYHGITKYYI